MADNRASRADEQPASADQGKSAPKQDPDALNPIKADEQFSRLAEDLPANDPVQKAYKEALQADDPQAEAKAKAKVVKESPDSGDTPSGYALQKVVGISDDAERGEEYQKHRAAKRHGYADYDAGE